MRRPMLVRLARLSVITLMVACSNSVTKDTDDGDSDDNDNHQSDSSDGDSALGQAVLTWHAPTLNTDGSTLDDLDHYEIAFGTTSGSYVTTWPDEIPASSCTAVDDHTECTHTITGLGADTWYFVVSAINSSGVASSYSNEATKTIQ